MTAMLLLLVAFVFSSTSGSSISFCEDLPDDKAYLDVSNVGINTLKKSFLHGASFKCLNLADNVIKSIDPEAFAGLPALEYLDLSRNTIDDSDFVELHEFKKLKTLILDESFSPIDRNYETTIERNHHHFGRQNWFDYDDPYTTTERNDDYRRERLNNKEEQKRQYYKSLFDSSNGNVIFTKLEKLSFCYYQVPMAVPQLSRFVFANLTQLYLNGNRLENDDILPTNVKKNLTHLYLDDNEINAFSGKGLEQLRHLSLNNNKITRLCSIYCNANAMTPRAMNSLENLSIAGNAIVAVDVDAFADSTNLVTLDLSHNEIEDFAKHTFGNMTKLKDLKLDHNRLSRIPDICALGNLRTLSLDGNRITSIDETSFCNLTKLTYVNLRENHLIGVASGTFRHLRALTTLDLSWNDISMLPKNWMGSNVKLETLNLNANFFNDVANMSLGQFNGLGTLSIGRNPLTSMTVESLSILPKNTVLDLTHAGNR